MSDDHCDLLCLDLPRAEELRASVLDDARASGACDAGGGARRCDAPAGRLALAAGGELCVCDLAWITGRAENLISHHVRVLRGAGVAASRRQGKMVLYRLTEPGAALLERVTSFAPASIVAAT